MKCGGVKWLNIRQGTLLPTAPVPSNCLPVACLLKSTTMPLATQHTENGPSCSSLPTYHLKSKQRLQVIDLCISCVFPCLTTCKASTLIASSLPCPPGWIKWSPLSHYSLSTLLTQVLNTLTLQIHITEKNKKPWLLLYTKLPMVFICFKQFKFTFIAIKTKSKYFLSSTALCILRI